MPASAVMTARLAATPAATRTRPGWRRLAAAKTTTAAYPHRVSASPARPGVPRPARRSTAPAIRTAQARHRGPVRGRARPATPPARSPAIRPARSRATRPTRSPATRAEAVRITGIEANAGWRPGWRPHRPRNYRWGGLMDQVIRFRSAVALAGRFPVLAGIDVDVALGDVVLVRGANGAGKTSLLRACAGLLRVVAGEATVLGCDLVADQRAVRRRVGLLGHQTGLYEEMTPAENLRFALRAARRPPAAAGPALEILGITGRLATTPVGSLSARQR